MTALRVLRGEKADPRPCPACRRTFPPGRRHKDRLGVGRAGWCPMVANPDKDRAADLMIRAHDTIAGLYLNGEYARLIALVGKIERELKPRS